jgi:hypothetical protein
MKKHFDLNSLSDSELLDVRICDLDITVEGTWIEEALETLHGELERRGLEIRPHAWLSTEFFVPHGIPGIGIPFYLAHPRLMSLERKEMKEVEGGSKGELMMILRHESGHVLDNAFHVGRDPKVRALFGRWTKRYPEQYTPTPSSKRYVHHLRLYYAQSHPHEDFAETFAVVLGSRSSRWRKDYEGWPALEKLEYVDALIETLRGKAPRLRNRRVHDAIGTLRTTLGEYYQQKHERYDDSFPSTYDPDLKRLFSDDPKHRHSEPAARFLRRNRSEIRGMLSEWTRDVEYTREQVLNDLIGRSRELNLRAAGPERLLKREFAILLAVKTMDFHYHQRKSFAL